jgi:hypothetical protein
MGMHLRRFVECDVGLGGQFDDERLLCTECRFGAAKEAT